MNNDLDLIFALLSNNQPIEYENFSLDPTCRDYLGASFSTNNQSYIFRKAKLTPKKIGHFVTLWKRDSNNKTIPYTQLDPIDFLIISTEDSAHNGFFVFPKDALIKHGILSSPNNPGKRGFRIYANWLTPDNKQATISQSWQKEYFINLNDDFKLNHDRLKSITNLNNNNNDLSK